MKFTVVGKPTPWQRAGKNSKRHYDEQGAAKDTFAAWASSAQPDIPILGPVHVNIVFYHERPKCHFTKSGELKPCAPIWNTNTPDIDNLVKFVLDALNGLWWKDDRQIVSVCCQKFYGDQAATTVEVIELEHKERSAKNDT